MIVDQHLIVLGKLRHLKYAPRGEADAGTGHENQRISLAVEFVVEIDVVDFDLTAFKGFRRLHPSSVVDEPRTKRSYRIAILLSTLTARGIQFQLVDFPGP